MSGTTVLSLPQNRRGSSSVTAVGVVAIIGRGAYLLLSLIGLISSGDTSFSKVKWIGISLLLGLGALEALQPVLAY